MNPHTTYIVAPNHQSMMDIPMVSTILDQNFKFVSKREVYNMPIIGWILWLRGDIAIERGGLQSVKKFIKDAKANLEDKTSTVIFPEGTRSKNGRVGKLKMEYLWLQNLPPRPYFQW